jgi:SEC-C motif-containing protein
MFPAAAQELPWHSGGMLRPAPPPDPCPCGHRADYAACCGRWLDGPEPAPDAETLMRSRYTAFVRGRQDHLLATWHPRTRPATLEPPPEGLRWLGLEVRGHRQQGHEHAEVRFVARSKLAGRAHRLQETSRFERVDGRWLYVDGDVS